MDDKHINEFFEEKMQEISDMQKKITETGREVMKEVSEKLDKYLNVATIPKESFHHSGISRLYGILKEHSVYEVKVKVRANNPEHTSILFTGFNSGGYWSIYDNNYSCPVNIKDIYCIRIVGFLMTKKS